jgi:hypothetical protein
LSVISAKAVTTASKMITVAIFSMQYQKVGGAKYPVLSRLANLIWKNGRKYYLPISSRKKRQWIRPTRN